MPNLEPATCTCADDARDSDDVDYTTTPADTTASANNTAPLGVKSGFNLAVPQAVHTDEGFGVGWVSMA